LVESVGVLPLLKLGLGTLVHDLVASIHCDLGIGEIGKIIYDSKAHINGELKEVM
jgi:hypothetical protein